MLILLPLSLVDTLALRFNGTKVPLLKTGIAWPTDKEAKFKNPVFSPNANFCDADGKLELVVFDYD